MSVHAINHPLVQHKLGLMRAAGISTKSFRELASEVAKLLTYEATQDLELETTTIDAWSGNELDVQSIKGKKVTIIHGPLENLDMPSMTMVFKADETLIANMKEGQNIEFVADRVKGKLTVTAMK